MFTYIRIFLLLLFCFLEISPLAPLNLKEYAIMMFDNETILVVPTKLINTGFYMSAVQCSGKTGKDILLNLCF